MLGEVIGNFAREARKQEERQNKTGRGNAEQRGGLDPDLLGQLIGGHDDEGVFIKIIIERTQPHASEHGAKTTADEELKRCHATYLGMTSSNVYGQSGHRFDGLLQKANSCAFDAHVALLHLRFGSRNMLFLLSPETCHF